MNSLRLLLLGGIYLAQGFRELGHEVITVGPDAGADIQLGHPMTAARLLSLLSEHGFSPDAMLYTDNGNLPQFIGLETLPCPSLFYSIDTFCNPWHLPYAYAFDGVCAAQKEHAEFFAAEGHDALWLPLFCSHVPKDEQERDVPVAFVGTLRPKNIPSRHPFLLRFRERHPLFIKEGNFVPIFARARIVLNQTAASELNFRCFEAMSCGAALLTEQCQGLKDVFVPGENILPPYPRNNAEAAAHLAATWLAKPEKLTEIALAGKELVSAHHTAMHRALTITRRFNELLNTSAQQRRLTDTHRRHFLSTAYGILAAELHAPHLSKHKDLYLQLFQSCK